MTLSDSVCDRIEWPRRKWNPHSSNLRYCCQLWNWGDLRSLLLSSRSGGGAVHCTGFSGKCPLLWKNTRPRTTKIQHAQLISHLYCFISVLLPPALWNAVPSRRQSNPSPLSLGQAVPALWPTLRPPSITYSPSKSDLEPCPFCQVFPTPSGGPSSLLILYLVITFIVTLINFYYNHFYFSPPGEISLSNIEVISSFFLSPQCL